MRIRPARPLLLCLAVLFAGCASTPSNPRIAQNQARFNTYTPQERKLIRMGEVAVGFTQEQVRMALGAPSRERTTDTRAGKQIVWEYRRIDPGIGLSIGAGAGTRGRTGVGGGIGVSASPDRTELVKRVVFDRATGEVSRVESYD